MARVCAEVRRRREAAVEAMKKIRLVVWIVVLLYLALFIITNREAIEVTLLPGTTAASIKMWKGLLAVAMLLVGFAIGFFRGRASVKA